MFIVHMVVCGGGGCLYMALWVLHNGHVVVYMYHCGRVGLVSRSQLLSPLHFYTMMSSVKETGSGEYLISFLF